jgi:hypothetical protein
MLEDHEGGKDRTPGGKEGGEINAATFELKYPLITI